MRNKILIIIVLIIGIIVLPLKVNAEDWKESLNCTSKEGFRPNEVVTCTYKVTPPSGQGAAGITGKIEVSNKLDVQKIESDKGYQGEILKNVFSYYALSEQADIKENEFEVIKITIKLKEESKDEYIKIKDVTVSNKVYKDVYLNDIETKIKIEKESEKKEEKNEITNAVTSRKKVSRNIVTNKNDVTTTKEDSSKNSEKIEDKDIKKEEIIKTEKQKIEKQERKTSIIVLLSLLGILIVILLIRKFKKTSE